MASVIETVLSAVIEERLGDVVFESLPKQDPVWPEILATSTGVTRGGAGLGRDFLIKKVYKTGTGGWGHWAAAINPSGDLLDTEAGTPAGSRALSTPRTYPAFNEGSIGEYLTVDSQLVKRFGNIFLDENTLLADSMDASIHNLVGDRIADAGVDFALANTLAFYAEDGLGTGSDIDNVFATVGATHTDPDDSGNAAVVGDSAITVNISQGEMNNFRPGARYELFSAAGTVRRHAAAATLRNDGTAWLHCDSVDPFGETAVLRLHGGGTFDTEVVTGDILIQQRDPTASPTDIRNTSAGGKSRQPYGLFSWVKSSGTIFGENGDTGINLTTAPQFKSLVDTSLTGVLTETELNQFMGRFWHRLGGLVELDTFITTIGILNGFFTGIDGAARWERNNTTPQAKLGWSDWNYTLNGRSMRVMLSRGLTAGNLIGLQLKNKNLKMFIPPESADSTQTDARVSKMVRFINPGNIFSVARNASLPTDLREAPFNSHLQYFPDQVQSLRLGVFTESI